MNAMRSATITFPMLGDRFSINPSATFHIFGWTFYWYGAIIAFGFLLAAIYCFRRSRQFGISNDDLIDLLIFAVPSGIIGARLYYVIFNFSEYVNNPIDIIKIWEGGLAIYGGIIGGLIATVIFCKVKKIPIGPILDIGSFGLLIGQAVGRWGNFINREAFGAETRVPWRMGLTPAGSDVTFYVHPTFLYESLWNALGLLLLHILSKKNRRKYDGQMFIYYMCWYGLGRLYIEGLRTDSLYLPGTDIRVSQLLAGLSLLAGLIILFINKVFRYHEPEQLWVNRVQAMKAGKGIESEPAGNDDGFFGAAQGGAPEVENRLPHEERDEAYDEPVVEPVDVVLFDEIPEKSLEETEDSPKNNSNDNNLKEN
ncbi:MAG: prolipoprotein diacylglyceryl transferase [Oscillospiraceae bacterium]|jgi:phosphatidylglycerol:prolipoprotein diacylglycerol transferase